MDPDPIPAIIYLLTSLLIFGIAVAAEISLATVNRSQIRQMAENEQFSSKKRRAQTVDNLLDNAPRFLTSMMLIRNLTMVIATSTLVYLLTTLPSTITFLITSIATLWIFFVALRVIVRTFSSRNSISIGLWVAPFASAIVLFFRPFSALLRKLEQIISGEADDVTKDSIFLTEDGLRLLIDVGDEENYMEEREKEMIASILDLDETLVREVMVPRIDIVAMSKDATLTEALDIIINAGHSRIPVYDESVDRIIGVLYAKDLLKYFRNAQYDIAIHEALRSAYFVPASKTIDVLFNEMKQQRVHMALVVDEYGGTSGLVTIEDLLEEIVGEIQDEYDQDVETLFELIAPNTYLLGSRISIYDLKKLLELELDHMDVDTLGGLLYTLSEHVPEQGETVDVENWRFTVLSVDGHRMRRVKAEPIAEIEMTLPLDENQGATMNISTRESIVNT